MLTLERARIYAPWPPQFTHLLKSILLQTEIAKELSILLDVLRYLLNEGPPLPEIVLECDAIRQKEADDVERSDSSELPIQVTEDFALAIPKGEARVQVVQLGDDEQVGNRRAVLLSFLVFRGERDTGCGEKLPFGARNVAPTKDLVKEED